MVPWGQVIVSWVLAAVAAAGTGTLAWVGYEQHRREKTPHLLLTGARAGRGGQPGPYRAELANLSPHNLWIDGVYADWWTQGDGRIAFGTERREDRYTNHRTPLVPGKWVTLAQVFPADEGEQATSEERQAVIAAVFHYAPTGTKLHKRAWRVRGGLHTFEAEEIPAPAWLNERRRGG